MLEYLLVLVKSIIYLIKTFPNLLTFYLINSINFNADFVYSKVFLCSGKIHSLTSEIAFGNFTNFLPSIPHVQNSQEGSQHQVLNRAVRMSKNVASNVSILKIERSGKAMH